MFPVETISAKMLDYYVDRRDTLIIDLREKESYMHSHVKGAVNMPYGEIDGYTAFPKGKILVLYCDRPRTFLTVVTIPAPFSRL